MLEGVNEVLRTEEKFYGRSQTRVEGRASMPEGATVIATLAEGTITRCEVLNGEADIDGMVVFSVLCDSGETVCVRAVSNFSHNVSVAGARPRAMGVAFVTVSEAQAQMSEGELHLMAQVDISVTVMDKMETKCITQLKGDHIQVMECELESVITMGNGSARCSAQKDISLENRRLADVKNVLLSTATAQVTDAYCSEDRVMLAGEVTVRMLVSCEDEFEPFGEIEEKIEFTHAVDAPGTDAVCEPMVWPSVEEIFADVHMGAEGKADFIAVEVILNNRVSSSKPQNKKVVCDAYSTMRKLNCMHGTFKTCAEKRHKANSSVRLAAPLPENMPPIAKVLFCEVHPSVADVQSANGSVMVDGLLDAVIVYRAAGAGLQSYRAELPFTCEMDIPDVAENAMCRATCKVVQKNAVITAADETELRVQMEFDCSMVMDGGARVMLSAEEGDEFGDRPAICIYTVGENDTLWDVAKYLGVAMGDLSDFNSDLSDKPMPGSKVMAYRQIFI